MEDVNDQMGFFCLGYHFVSLLNLERQFWLRQCVSGLSSLQL